MDSGSHDRQFERVETRRPQDSMQITIIIMEKPGMSMGTVCYVVVKPTVGQQQHTESICRMCMHQVRGSLRLFQVKRREGSPPQFQTLRRTNKETLIARLLPVAFSSSLI